MKPEFLTFGYLVSLLTSLCWANPQFVYNVDEGNGLQIALSAGEGTPGKVLTQGNRWHFSPSISPSGKFIAYSEGPEKDQLGIVTLEVATGLVEEWTAHGNMYVHPRFSGDERFLVFSGPIGPGGRAQIGVIDFKTARETGTYSWIEVDGVKRKKYLVSPKIVESEYPSYFPSISSDGSFVTFQRVKTPENKDIAVYDFFQEKLSILSPEAGFSMAPALSFDDRFVAYSQKNAGVFDLFLYDRVTENTRQITQDEHWDQLPTFSPEGSVVYASKRGESFQLYKIAASDIKENKLVSKPFVTGAGEYSFASFSGDARAIQGLLPEIPEPPRSSFGSARLQNRIYIAGGHKGHEHTYPKESFMDSLEYFDVDSKTWHTAKPRPHAAHGYGIIAYGKYIYAFGGFTYSEDHKPKWKSLDEVDRYDSEKDEWVTVGKLPRRRSSYVVVELEGKAYFFGGWDSTPKFINDADGIFHREIDVFDLETEKASTLPYGLPDPLRRAFTGVVWGDDIVLLGGIGEGASHFNLLDNVTVFNPFQGTFKELPKLPVATFAPAAGILGNELFVFGGMLKVGKLDYRYLNQIYHLNLRKLGDGWTNTGRFLSEPKGFSQVVNLDCRTLGVLGGHRVDTENDAPVPTFEMFRWLSE